MLSVLLALTLDEWRENRARDERMALTLAAIRSELEANRSVVEEAAALHAQLRDTLAAMAAANRIPSPEICYHRGMFNPARLVSTAWESARETAIVDRLPCELVLQPSQVYTDEHDYAELRDRIAADIMNGHPEEQHRNSAPRRLPWIHRACGGFLRISRTEKHGWASVTDGSWRSWIRCGDDFPAVPVRLFSGDEGDGAIGGMTDHLIV